MKIVLALGGNALGKTPLEQLELVKKTAKTIVDLVEEGHKVVVTHGNGPQVGMINLAMDYACENGANTPPMPFAECGAMSQGYIGYHLQQAIENELKRRQIDKECVTVVTQVLVSKKDKAFLNPTKPVGMFYTKEEADKISKEKGYVMKEDAGRGYRRVVPSPYPKKIIELETINSLVEEGNIVISCGGGGIPVIEENGHLKGIDAVIDKDNSSSLLACEINADMLMILTAVSKVSLNFNKENQKDLDVLDIEDAKKYIKDNQFAKGSMLPKIEACIDFVEETNKVALITSLLNDQDALLGQNGTLINKNMERKKQKMAKEKKKKLTLTSFSIILAIIVVLGVVTHFLPSAKFVDEEIVPGSGVVAAKLSDVLMAPIKGFENAVDVCIFVFILGGFLAIVTKTGALETGIKVLVKKMKGKELILIPILMFIFSIGGTTYGMLEETVGFYALLAFTMVAAGMDTIVSSAIVLLGAGSGVLGSTINPFATGAAISALKDSGITVNNGLIIFLGIVLWIVSLTISICFVISYAKKIIDEKGSTFLSLQEQKVMERRYEKKALKEEEKNAKVSLTGVQKLTLIIFGLTFVVMIIGFIPWGEFGITFFDGFTGWLTGSSLGNWWFYEAALWFLLMAILIGIINRFSEKDIVDTFIDGAADMMSVILIVAVARGASVLMSVTHLDNYIVVNAANALKNMPVAIFTPLNYLLHIFLSVLVPSSSGLASLSTPIMGPLTNTLGYSVEVTVMTYVAANGLVNLITPTCGAIMGGLALAGVNYGTWFKWAFKVVLTIALASVVILTAAALIL